MVAEPFRTGSKVMVIESFPLTQRILGGPACLTLCGSMEQPALFTPASNSCCCPVIPPRLLCSQFQRKTLPNTPTPLKCAQRNGGEDCHREKTGPDANFPPCPCSVLGPPSLWKHSCHHQWSLLCWGHPCPQANFMKINGWGDVG